MDIELIAGTIFVLTFVFVCVTQTLFGKTISQDQVFGRKDEKMLLGAISTIKPKRT